MLAFPIFNEIRLYDSEPDGPDLNSSGVKTNLNVEASGCPYCSTVWSFVSKSDSQTGG